MYKLIVAEKPSVAMSIAKVLGATKRKEGFIEGNGYIVSWCYGHLANLVHAETYNEKYVKWSYDDLPIFPDPWQYKLGKDKYQHFKILKTLMHRSDVSQVINACDAGREGELIFRNAYNLAECEKPVMRLWISSMEDEAIRKGFKELKPGSMYDNLYAAADCRAKADWLVGINFTRLFSVLYHRTLKVGRVMTPTLALIISREAERDAFVSEKYYKIQIDCGTFKATSEQIKDKALAEKALADCEGQSATVYKITGEEKEEKAPLLYDLTSLQRDANRILGYTAQQTLDYVQALYEKKLCTYPRTDARYLTNDMENSVEGLVKISAQLLGTTLHEYSSKKICNSKRVTDHHAIVPTVTAGETELFTLPSGEREILKLIALRMLCAVSMPCVYFFETAVIRCGSTDFKVTYKDVTEWGWRIYTNNNSEDELFIENGIEDGDVYEVFNASLKEGKTKPKPRFTEDTLLSAMEHASAAEMPEDAERKGLGTPATRAGIIEKLIATGFIERKKEKKSVSLVPSNTGKSLITVIPEHIQSPLLTAEWEHKLKLIEKGKLKPEDFMSAISEMVTDMVENYIAVAEADVLFPSGREVIGKCPRCGTNVTESKNGFFCESTKCRFGLWRDNHFFENRHIILDKAIASALVNEGRCRIPNIYSYKTDKNYAGTVILTDNGEKTVLRVVV